MVDITLIELHLDDSSLTANAPFSSGRKEVEAGDEPPIEEEDSSGRSLLPAVVGLVFLVAVAYVVRTKVLGGGGDEQLELADVEA